MGNNTNDTQKFAEIISAMRGLTYRMIDESQTCKGIVGRNRLTQKLDGILGMALQVITEIEEHSAPLPKRKAADFAKYETLGNVVKFTRVKQPTEAHG